jgi:hypothetical protein
LQSPLELHLTLFSKVHGSQIYTRFSPSVISDALSVSSLTPTANADAGSAFWRCCGVHPHQVMPPLQAAAASMNQKHGTSKWDSCAIGFRYVADINCVLRVFSWPVSFLFLHQAAVPLEHCAGRCGTWRLLYALYGNSRWFIFYAIDSECGLFVCLSVANQHQNSTWRSHEVAGNAATVVGSTSKCQFVDSGQPILVSCFQMIRHFSLLRMSWIFAHL